MRKSRFYGCSIKELPDKEMYAAAKHAIGINPANRAPVESFASIGVEPDKYTAAVLTTKYWGAAGVNLTVGFLSQASAALQEKIVRYLNFWNKYANINFTITSGSPRNAQVRIGLGQGGYYSFLGTDVLRVSAGQITMNFQGFTVNTPDEEYERVVPHEGFHTCGGIHEHSRREILDLLDERGTIAEFKRTQNWTEQQIRQQILAVTDESLLLNPTPRAYENSIMAYWFSGACTKSGKPILGGSKITVEDGAYAGKLYPLAITPPPPPPPVGGKRIFQIEVAGDNITAARILP